MAKRAEKVTELQIERPPRLKLSAAESLKRMKGFDRRKDQFVAAVRKSKGRSLPA